MRKTSRRTGRDRTRAAYRDRRRAQMQEWSAKLDLLQARARKKKAGVKIRYREQLEDLQQSLDSMRSRLRELERAGGATLEDVRTGVDEAAAEAKRMVDELSNRVKRD